MFVFSPFALLHSHEPSRIVRACPGRVGCQPIRLAGGRALGALRGSLRADAATSLPPSRPKMKNLAANGKVRGVTAAARWSGACRLLHARPSFRRGHGAVPARPCDARAGAAVQPFARRQCLRLSMHLLPCENCGSCPCLGSYGQPSMPYAHSKNCWATDRTGSRRMGTLWAPPFWQGDINPSWPFLEAARPGRLEGIPGAFGRRPRQMQNMSVDGRHRVCGRRGMRNLHNLANAIMWAQTA